MSFVYTERLLDAWGNWSKTRNNLGYSSVMGAIVDMGQTSGRRLCRTMRITDDIGLAVDRAITALEHRSPQLAQTIKLYYLAGLTFEAISKQISVGREKAAKLLKEAVSWLDAFLLCLGLAK
ncbi:antiterminator Q family protein [Catenovulum agarivorans]|uniref:antiterminator Q family protein n=1 Tax=Catenovulum agarivorans TaxID=1172192 RepID=UPI000366A3B9|nr:antiterminator Q family protein [Catenovulum agarivorans]